MKKQYWLLKTEPSTFSIDDLCRAKNQTTSWEGVRNYKARNFLRDGMKVGDLAFFYHSSCKVPAIVGIVQITRAGYPDPSAFNPASPYYDPKTSRDHPRWFMVDVKFKEQLDPPFPLSAIKELSHLGSLALIQKGNRLSVIPITSQQWQAILSAAKKYSA
ncbi:MAG: EVE domain-containing protein [Candidatus Berkiellales bacterium]